MKHIKLQDRKNMNTPLIKLLFKDYRRKVLSLMLLHPKQKYHVREIARLTNTLPGTLHKELSRLAEVGLLVKELIGNQLFYQVNNDCLILEELTHIFEKTNASEYITTEPKMDALVEKNRRKILSIAREKGILNVRVFGSMAKNDADENSDLDLLVKLEEGKSGFALGGFLDAVSKLVQRKVDVVTEKSLHPTIHDKIIREARAL